VFYNSFELSIHQRILKKVSFHKNINFSTLVIISFLSSKSVY